MRAAAGVALVVALLAGCDSDASPPDQPPGTAAGSPPTTSAGAAPGGEAPSAEDDEAAPGPDREVDLADARSDVREDSYYPAVGEPDIDALHYVLDLSWDPDRSELTGVAAIEFRAPADSTRLQLDLAEPLEPGRVRLDGRPVEATHPGKNLVVTGIDLTAGSEHVLRVPYTGSPEPVPAPSSRGDVEDLGWHTTDDGGAWTMQEPFGAYTWYPVNDQPADKAFFDLTIETPASMRGVSGGTMTADDVQGDRRTSSFRLAEPVASYLTTIAIGDYEHVTDTGPGGVGLNYWVLPGQEDYLEQLRRTPELLEWLTDRLGPFPFPTTGAVLVPSRSGMETQETVTIGAGPDPQAFLATMLHEYAHQWYGDMVTPRDWRDLWLNESFAMYLQLDWMSDVGMTTSRRWFRIVLKQDQQLRDEYGPPGAYDPEDFASSNVYLCGAAMLRLIRAEVGVAAFDRLLREWPRQHAYANADRADWIAFARSTAGPRQGARVAELTRDWLLSERTPTG